MNPRVTLTSICCGPDSNFADIPIGEWDLRQDFCDKTYHHLKKLGSEQGYAVEGQQISRDEDGFHFFADIGFGKEATTTWVQCFYRPLVVQKLMLEICGNTKHFEMPACNGNGHDDHGLSPEENASQLIKHMQQLAKDTPVSQSYTSFIRSSRLPHLYREVEAIGLIAEGYHQEAESLCRGVLAGEIESGCTPTIVTPEGTEFKRIQLILDWLEMLSRGDKETRHDH